MPDAQRTRSLACKVKNARKQVTTGTPKQPAFPARWFTAYGVLSPVSGLIATVTLRSSPQGLIPASGDQDHTISPSALTSFVSRCDARPPHPPPRFVTIGRNVPPGGSRMR
jgi:hypothetical protein